MKLNSTLLKSTVVAALGGLLFGFDTVVIAGAIQPLKALYHLSPFSEGFTVAAALVGTVIGSMLVGIPGDSPSIHFPSAIGSTPRANAQAQGAWV